MEITGFDSKYHSNNIHQNQEIINNFFGKRRLDANNPVTTNIIPPSSWGYEYSGENGMGTDNIQNNDNFVGITVANETYYINYVHRKHTKSNYHHNIKKSNYYTDSTAEWNRKKPYVTRLGVER
jgi:hypothetical protein